MTTITKQLYERVCLGPNCGAEFTTSKSQQTYCSYDCYYAATRDRNRGYYRKVREAGGTLAKICPTCHEHFETKKLRVKYCSGACYHEACLEKNRAFAQKVRDEYKAAHPRVLRRDCDLCGKPYEYKTKQGKYCLECASLARKIARGQGPLRVNPLYQTAPEITTETKTATAATLFNCFICEKPRAPAADVPCAACEA